MTIDGDYPTFGYDPRLADAAYPSTPGLWPIRQAAAYAGMSVNGFAAAVENGDIPVVIRRVGRSGKRFVCVEHLRTWVGGLPPTNEPASEPSLF